MNRDFSFRTIEAKDSLGTSEWAREAGVHVPRRSRPSRDQIVGFYIRGATEGSGFITCRAKACVANTLELGHVVKARDVAGRPCFHCGKSLISKDYLEAMSL